MLNFCGIVAAILKMETGRNFSMSGMNSGHQIFSSEIISSIELRSCAYLNWVSNTASVNALVSYIILEGLCYISWLNLLNAFCIGFLIHCFGNDGLEQVYQHYNISESTIA
jgi:hypothetical protein